MPIRFDRVRLLLDVAFHQAIYRLLVSESVVVGVRPRERISFHQYQCGVELR